MHLSYAVKRWEDVCHSDQYIDCEANLVQALGWRHGSLDGQGTHVLPALLQQRDEVVDGQHDVANQLIFGHANVANGSTHAQNLLQLELNGRLDLRDLAAEVIRVRDGRREFAGYMAGTRRN